MVVHIGLLGPDATVASLFRSKGRAIFCSPGEGARLVELVIEVASRS